jgi:hypothetical protein
MNPTVQVAYEKNWYLWHTVVLKIGVIRWWLGTSSCVQRGFVPMISSALESRVPFEDSKLDLGSGRTEEGLLHLVGTQYP